MEKIIELCLQNRSTPFSVVYACKDTHGGVVLNPDETTEWFKLLCKMMLENFDKMPNVTTCNRFKVAEKEVFMPQIIEHFASKTAIRCKKCKEAVVTQLNMFDKLTTTFGEFVDATKELEARRDVDSTFI